MTRPSHFRESERSRWLAKLAAALTEAQGILASLDDETAQSADVLHLKARIAAIRSEVELLRRGGFPGDKEVGRKSPERPRWPGWNR